MVAHPAAVRPSVARLAAALGAVALLAAGCGESAPEPETVTSASSSAASDGGGEATVEPSDGGGQSVAAVPEEPYAVTPPPEGFEPPEPCTGEGAHLVEVGGAADPALPERAGDALTIEATGIEGEAAQLRATLGDGDPRAIEDMTIGETAAVDLWTISVTSVCADTQQIEFDLID